MVSCGQIGKHILPHYRKKHEERYTDYNVIAIKEIEKVYDEIRYQWEDHYCVQVDKQIPKPPNKYIANDHQLQWVDEQELDKKIVIDDVNFFETDITTVVCNFEGRDNDEWIHKLVDDLCMITRAEEREIILSNRSDEINE